MRTDERLSHDFVEGVRAKLINKNKEGPPKWQPSTIGEVDVEAMQGVVRYASSLTVPPAGKAEAEGGKWKQSTTASTTSSLTSIHHLPEGFVLEAVVTAGGGAKRQGQEGRVSIGLPSEEYIRSVVMKLGGEKGTKPQGKGESKSKGGGGRGAEGEGETSPEAVDGIIGGGTRGTGDAMTAAAGETRGKISSGEAEARARIIEVILKAYKGKHGVRERVDEVVDRKCVQRAGGGLEWRD
ncbi:hypothetical protein FRC17_011297 [Serendipita sp. 399]|nr:hypothetical protein FRC17_011297 [Serendipita sp. 399]